MLLPDKWSNKGNLQTGALDSLYHFFYFPLYIKQCQSTLTNKSNLMYVLETGALNSPQSFLLLFFGYQAMPVNSDQWFKKSIFNLEGPGVTSAISFTFLWISVKKHRHSTQTTNFIFFPRKEVPGPHEVILVFFPYQPPPSSAHTFPRRPAFDCWWPYH